MHPVEVEALYKLCVQVPPTGVVIEVGCQLGRSSSVIEQVGKALRHKIIHIDPYTEAIDALKSWAETMYRIGGDREHAFTLLCMRTEQATWHLSNYGQIDMAFIDGNHDKEAVEIDLALVAEKIKVGGILVCHDYSCAEWHGVADAVDPYLSIGEWEHLGTWFTMGAWRRK